MSRSLLSERCSHVAQIIGRTVVNAFTNVNQTLYGHFNASMMNDSQAVVNQAIAQGVVPVPSYLFATLLAANATVPDSNTGSDSNASNSDGSSGNNTNLAM